MLCCRSCGRGCAVLYQASNSDADLRRKSAEWSTTGTPLSMSGSRAVALAAWGSARKTTAAAPRHALVEERQQGGSAGGMRQRRDDDVDVAQLIRHAQLESGQVGVGLCQRLAGGAAAGHRRDLDERVAAQQTRRLRADVAADVEDADRDHYRPSEKA